MIRDWQMKLLEKLFAFIEKDVAGKYLSAVTPWASVKRY